MIALTQEDGSIEVAIDKINFFMKKLFKDTRSPDANEDNDSDSG